MLKMTLSIANPFSKGVYSNYYNYNGVLSGNKLIEINVDRVPQTLFNFELNCSTSDGPTIELRVFGFGFSVDIYDRRAWDYNSNSWQDQDTKSGS